MANVNTLHGRLLRIFAESTKARNVVEIGTSNGYSALWLCLGLRTSGGRLTTFEIDPRSFPGQSQLQAGRRRPYGYCS